MNNTTIESITAEIGEEVSECCSAPGPSETQYCSRCQEHTTYYWEADEDEVRVLFNERNSIK